MEKTLKLVLMYGLLVYGLALLTASCGSAPKTVKIADPSWYAHWRGIVEENGTVVPVVMDFADFMGHRQGDRVWVNLRTGRIDQLNDSAMICRLTSDITFNDAVIEIPIDTD